MSVLKKYNKETEAGRIVPNDKQKQNTSDALTQFRKTDFDLEDRAPFGGPINSPQHGFAQKYTPNKTFTASDEGAIRGRGKFRQEKSIFRETSLDLENKEPVGGPNRTNAPNIPSGFYQVNTQQGPLEYKQGNLAGKEGKTIVNQNLHQFTPTNTYLDFIKPYKQQ